MPDQTGPTPDPFVNATLALSDDEFFALYGPWTPMTPGEISEMLSGCLASGVAPKGVDGDQEGARETVGWFPEVFGKDSYLTDIDA